MSPAANWRVPFQPQRVALLAGVATSVVPPYACKNVKIGNAGIDDLKVYGGDPTDDTKYFVIPGGFEKPCENAAFVEGQVAFYLKPVQDGTAVLIWY